jgi:hypothetical protein
MRPLAPFEVASCNVAEIVCVVPAVLIFFRICRDLSSIEGAPSIKDWTTKKPFYFFVVLRAHSLNFPSSRMTTIYWLLAIVACAANTTLMLHNETPHWATNLICALAVVPIAFVVLRNEFARRSP